MSGPEPEEVHADTPDQKELPFGKEVPGSNHDGYAEAEVVSPGPESDSEPPERM